MDTNINNIKEYRTFEQWENIATNAYNWNWSDACKDCAEYGFYAVDLIRFYEEESFWLEVTSLAYLAEGAEEERNKIL